MALVDLKGGGIWFPEPILDAVGSVSIYTPPLSAANMKVGYVLTCGKAGKIQKVIFQVFPPVFVSGDVDIRLEGVDQSNGEPDGTLLDVSAEDVAFTISSGGFKTADFGAGNGYTVSKGEIIAVVIQPNPSSSPNVSIQVSMRGDWAEMRFPYVLFDGGGGWIKQATSNRPSIALEFDDGILMPALGTRPGEFENTAISNATTPDEKGLIFQLPFPFRVMGAWAWIRPNFTLDFKLYDSDDSVLETVSFVPGIRASTDYRLLSVPFDATRELLKNTNYRLTILPTTSDATNLIAFNYDSADMLKSCGIGGTKFHGTERTDAGSFSETTTRVPMMGIIVDQLDEFPG